MANAFQCDRCREFQQGSPRLSLNVESTSVDTTDEGHKDLCNTCTQDFKWWLQNVVRETAGQAR